MNNLDFQTAVAPCLPDLRAYALSLTRNAVDADDVVQDTLERALRFWGAVAAGTPQGGVYGWLRLMLYRLFCNRYKRTQRAREVAEAAAPATSGDLRDHVDALDARQRLGRAMDAINPLRREIIERVLVQGESYQAVADALNLPIGTVMSNLHRARRALQEALSGSARNSPGIDLVGFETPEGVQPDPDAVDDVVRHRHERALAC